MRVMAVSFGPSSTWRNPFASELCEKQCQGEITLLFFSFSPQTAGYFSPECSEVIGVSETGNKCKKCSSRGLSSHELII